MTAADCRNGRVFAVIFAQRTRIESALQGQYMIEVENLTKRYGTFLAIDKVNFKIGSGEIVGFLGPNGAGKTTTMRLLTGFLAPSSGVVRVNHLDVHSQSVAARKHIGYLPETVPLYLEMTVHSYLKFFGSLRGMARKRRDQRIREVLKICRIENYADTQIGKLSKGYKQLVGLSQAILHEPEVLILDEPTNGIDARQVVQIRQLIKDLGREHTVILSSHILSEVSMICQKVIIIDRGKIIAQDNAETLSSRLKSALLFKIQIKGPVEEIKASLGRLKGVRQIKVTGEGETRLYQVECERGNDIRDKLASAIVSDGYRLLELTSSEMSLEDIFLKLTTNEQG